MSLKETVKLWFESCQLFDKGDFAGALAQLDAIEELSAKLHWNKGRIYLRQGQFQRAVDEFSESASRDPHLAIAYFTRGLAQYHLSRFSEAADDFASSLKYLRENLLIDYKQLGLVHRLCKCEILHNQGISLMKIRGREREGETLCRDAANASLWIFDGHNAFEGNKTGHFAPLFEIGAALLFEPAKKMVDSLPEKQFVKKSEVKVALFQQDKEIGFQGEKVLERIKIDLRIEEKRKAGPPPRPPPAVGDLNKEGGMKKVAESQFSPPTHIALHAYEVSTEGDLALEEGDKITVTKDYGDGWLKGVSLRTTLTGLFPASFVELLPDEPEKPVKPQPPSVAPPSRPPPPPSAPARPPPPKDAATNLPSQPPPPPAGGASRPPPPKKASSFDSGLSQPSPAVAALKRIQEEVQSTEDLSSLRAKLKSSTSSSAILTPATATKQETAIYTAPAKPSTPVTNSPPARPPVADKAKVSSAVSAGLGSPLGSPLGTSAPLRPKTTDKEDASPASKPVNPAPATAPAKPPPPVKQSSFGEAGRVIPSAKPPSLLAERAKAFGEGSFRAASPSGSSGAPAVSSSSSASSSPPVPPPTAIARPPPGGIKPVSAPPTVAPSATASPRSASPSAISIADRAKALAGSVRRTNSASSAGGSDAESPIPGGAGPSSTTTTETVLKVKMHFKDTRVMNVGSSVSLAEFVQLVQAKFEASVDLRLWFAMFPGAPLLKLSDSSHLSFLMDAALRDGSNKLVIWCSEDDTAPSPSV